MALCWEKTRPDGYYANSGELVVAMVMRRDCDNGAWFWHVNGVHMKYIGKSQGTVKTFATAKRAVERNWARWLAHASLQPIP